MKKKLLITGLCAVLLFTAGCVRIPKLENGEEVVASIDGKDVSADEIYKVLKAKYGAGVLVNILDEFITNKEIETDKTAETLADSQIKLYKEQYGDNFNAVLISSGYANEQELRNFIILSYKKDKVVENYLKKNLKDSEINDYYEKEIFGEITAKHILIKPDTTDSATAEEKAAAEAAALQKAKDLIEQLKNGADFDTLAKENSDDTASAGNGGLISDFTKDSVVSEFWDASYALKDGEYTQEPVKSTYGYHIILKVSQKEKPALEVVIDDIKQTLVDKKLKEDQNLADKTWAQIRKDYHLDIIDSDIKNAYDTTINSLK